MEKQIKIREKEYFEKDVSLLKSFLVKKVLGLDPKKGVQTKTTEELSVSSFNQADETPKPNKSQMTSQKVKEILWKTKQKLKLNKKTREGNFESKMKAFSGLESFIDSSHFIKNMNILNEFTKKEASGQLLDMQHLFQKSAEEEEEREEEPIFIVEGKPTTKFPRLKMKEELIEKAKGIIKMSRNKGRMLNRYSFQDNMMGKRWDEPEVREIGKEGLEIKRKFGNRNRVSINDNLNTISKTETSEIVPHEETKIPGSETMRNSSLKNDSRPSSLIIPNLGNSLHTRRTKMLESNPTEARKSIIHKSSSNIESQICSYLLEESKLITEQFEEKFIDDLKTGKFLLKWEEQTFDVNDQKIQAEMKKLTHLLQNNKKVAEKLKQDLKTGAYENAFKDQADKIGFLLKRAARNIFNQKAQLLEENMEKKNKKLKNRVLEISEFMKKQNSKSSGTYKSKYSNISSRYNMNSSSIKSTSKLLLNGSTDTFIEISDEKSNGKSLEFSKLKESLSNEKIKIPDQEKKAIPKSAISNPKSILKNRILSPIFLTDEKNLSLSKIEQDEEFSGLMSPRIIDGNLRLMKKKRGSLYEALNENYEIKMQKEETKKLVLKKKNKLENKELRQKLEKLLQDLDNSKVVDAEEKSEMKKSMIKMHEKWEKVDDKTKGIDALRLLARDYKANNTNLKRSLMLSGKRGTLLL